MAISQQDRMAVFGVSDPGCFLRDNGMNMAWVQPRKRSNPPLFTTDDEAYGGASVVYVPRRMGAKVAVEQRGVDTGFTRLVGRWNVRATGHR